MTAGTALALGGIMQEPRTEVSQRCKQKAMLSSYIHRTVGVH